MFKSPIKLFFFGLSFLFCLTVGFAQEDKGADKKEKNPVAGESKIIFDSGIGPFDWKGGKNNYQKSEQNPHLKALGESLELERSCPSCSTKLPLLVIKSPSESIDTDFCLHYVGESEYEYEIWSCSVCGFCCNQNLYKQPLNDEDKSFVKKYLTKNMHDEIKNKFKTMFKDLDKTPLKQGIIPVEAKVKNFSEYIEHHNAMSAKWKGFFILRCAYALRNEISKAPAVTSLNHAFLDLSRKQNKSLNIEEKDIKNPFTSYLLISFYEFQAKESKSQGEKIGLQILLAQQNNRVGEAKSALANLNSALNLIGNEKEFLDAKSFVERLIGLQKTEQQLIKKALEQMAEAINEKDQYISNVGPIIYLIGELYRRVGDYKNAYIWLQASTNFFTEGNMIHSWIANTFKKPYMQNSELQALKTPEVLNDYIKVFKLNKDQPETEPAK